MKQILNLKQVLALLCMSRSAYYNFRAAGIAPPHFKVGRNLNFDEHELDSWVETQKWTYREKRPLAPQDKFTISSDGKHNDGN